MRALRVEFGPHLVVGGVDFDLHAGETLGLVGESGAGKSSLARAILRLIEAADGSVQWRGEDLMACSRARLRELRRDMQIVFQNPAASLDPRLTISSAVAEPLMIFEPHLSAAARRAKTTAMLERVGLDADLSGRHPHELSGGQCQRAAVARAMILNPKLLVCDEPVSSLDVSIQGQIVNLLSDLQTQCGTAILFISHNLRVVRHMSDRIMVLYRGRCVELAPRAELFAAGFHPYTRALLAAATRLPAAGLKRADPAPADPAPADPAPADPAPASTTQGAAAGCSYRDRCGFAIGICETVVPSLSEIVPQRFAACHRARDFYEKQPV